MRSKKKTFWIFEIFLSEFFVRDFFQILFSFWSKKTNISNIKRGSVSGTDSQSSLSPNLKQSVLKVVNTRSICTRTNTNNNNYCALDDTNSSNACYGDSGGPLMHYRDGRWYLYGLTSFVLTQAAKCYPSLPSFYTIIPNYFEWIANIIATLTNPAE